MFHWQDLTVTFAYVCPDSQPDDLGESEGQTDMMDLVETEVEPAVEDELPYTTVVVRRGLALAGMLFILAAGVIINLLVTH